MRVIMNVIGAIALLIGVFYMFSAATFATGLKLEGASAIQITQVYTQATYNAAMGIGLLIIALIFVIGGKQNGQTVVYPQQQTAGPRPTTKDALSDLIP